MADWIRLKQTSSTNVANVYVAMQMNPKQTNQTGNPLQCKWVLPFSNIQLPILSPLCHRQILAELRYAEIKYSDWMSNEYF